MLENVASFFRISNNRKRSASIRKCIKTFANEKHLEKYGENNNKSFLDVKTYKNVLRWAKEINNRQAVKRGIMVNKIKGNPSSQLHERHSSSDFIHKTQDKLEK